MQELRRICDKYGILLVADEVQSGAGRTGKRWAIEHTGVIPTCMHGKGHRFRHAARRHGEPRRIDGLGPGAHASTFGGNPVCLAAALAILHLIWKRSLLANSARVGNYILSRIADWPQQA